MDKLAIQAHNFEKEKNQLRVLSEQTSRNLELKEVDISGGFLGLGNHKVTGEELNSLTSQIQSYLIDFNNLHRKFIEEFHQVYKIFEVLDNEYMKSILISIKAVEKNSNDVKVAQQNITKTVEIQKKTIIALKQFKEKIEGYKHLADVDKIWSNSQKLQNDLAVISSEIAKVIATNERNTQNIKSLQSFKKQVDRIKHLQDIDDLWNGTNDLKQSVASLDEKVNDLIRKLDDQVQTLESLAEFKDNLEKITHLADVDKLWDDTLQIHNEITSVNRNIGILKKAVRGQRKDLDELFAFVKSLKEYSHLQDIDVLWDKTEDISHTVTASAEQLDNAVRLIHSNKQSIDTLVQFKDRLNGYEHLKDIDETWKSCKLIETVSSSNKEQIDLQQSQIETLQNTILEMNESNEKRNQSISRKLKIAYILAGGSLGIAIVEFILLLVRIL